MSSCFLYRLVHASFCRWLALFPYVLIPWLKTLSTQASHGPRDARVRLRWLHRDLQLRVVRLVFGSVVALHHTIFIHVIPYLLKRFGVSASSFETTMPLDSRFSPPTQPYVTVPYIGNPALYTALATSPFFFTLPPEDLAHLDAKPARRARWEELVLHTVLPGLRELVPVLQMKVLVSWAPCRCVRYDFILGWWHYTSVQRCLTLMAFTSATRVQFHLAELGKIEALDNMMPGLGRKWASAFGGTQTNIFYLMAVYAMEWEVVAARWVQDDHALLQPATPCWIAPTYFAMNLVRDPSVVTQQLSTK